jgi:hypothetical protein
VFYLLLAVNVSQADSDNKSAILHAGAPPQARAD